MPEPHRIDLEEYDLAEAEAREVEAAQYRTLATTAAAADAAVLVEQAVSLEDQAARLRGQPPHRGQWITVKARRTYGDRLAVDAARLHQEVAGRQVVVTLDPVEHTLTKLDRAIEGWSVDWWNGQIPERQARGISEERRAALDAIDEEIGPWLVARVDEFYSAQRRSDDDTKG